MKNTLIVLLCAVAVLLSTYAVINSKQGTKSPLGYGQITPTVTATAWHSNTTATVVMASGSNYQSVTLSNGTVGGGADVYCAFGATSTANNGLYIAYPTSTANSRVVITDPNLLGKYMSCIGSSTLSVLAY